MRRETRLLLAKACDALVLSVELFNRPHDRGRATSTLIHLDHGFEMLMKAAILHRGGRIREKGDSNTIGFSTCVGKSLSDGEIKYLNQEQAYILQVVNGLRDAEQHYLLGISEAQLYIHIQSGVTLFRDLLKNVFDQSIANYLPTRILPISTSPPTDIETLFDSEVTEIRKLLNPGGRRRVEAFAKLRSLAILDRTINGETEQPTDPEIKSLAVDVLAGRNWNEIFPGVATIELTADGSGPNLSLRISKKEGTLIQIAPEGTPGAPVAIRRVNELDYYNLGANQLADNVGLTMPRTLAVVRYLGLQNNPESYKEFRIGKTSHKRYSRKAIERIREALNEESIDEIWAKRPFNEMTPTEAGG